MGTTGLSHTTGSGTKSLRFPPRCWGSLGKALGDWKEKVASGPVEQRAASASADTLLSAPGVKLLWCASLGPRDGEVVSRLGS